WVGKLFALFTSDPVVALHLLGVLSSTFCILPISVLAYRWRQRASGSVSEAQLAGIGAGLIWALVPISWLNGSEIFGDSLALFMSLGVLWLGWLALERKAKAPLYLITAGALYGLMLG